MFQNQRWKNPAVPHAPSAFPSPDGRFFRPPAPVATFDLSDGGQHLSAANYSNLVVDDSSAPAPNMAAPVPDHAVRWVWQRAVVHFSHERADSRFRTSRPSFAVIWLLKCQYQCFCRKMTK